MDRMESFKVQLGILLLCEIIAIGLLAYLGVEFSAILFVSGVILYNVSLVLWVIFRYNNDKKNREVNLGRILGSDAKDAFLYGEVGLIVYDENYVVSWFNDFLHERGFDLIGKKVSSWSLELNDLFNGNADTVVIDENDYVYEVLHKEGSRILYVKDITEISKLKEAYNHEKTVLGLLQLDNYMDASQYEDENTLAQMNVALRQPVLDWASENGIVIRRIRTDRFYAYLNEEIYAKIMKDKFSILSKVRENSKEIGVNVTLSMAFARGNRSLIELDDTVINLLELAQSRGGDQVAVKIAGQEVKYFGGNSEAQEKRSRVRVRVMAKAMKDSISDARRVFIVGHKNMDFDCMGSCLGVSRICEAYQKIAYIVSESGGIEEQCENTILNNYNVLHDRHRFITDSEASRMIKKEDLVIAVDFHNPEHCNAPMCLDKAEKVIVIDHHRRSESFIHNPLLVYVETSASSVSELVTEFIPYITSKFDLNEVEAMFMYLGILIDSNHFKARTGARTFEACALLRQAGVDPSVAEDCLKENYDEFEAKAEISSFAHRYSETIMIAAVDNGKNYSRTNMSKIADQLLTIKGIEASYVIAEVGNHHVAVSARSKGKINVQLVMEAMNGGGHFTAAALLRENSSVEEVQRELIAVIENRKMEEKNNESNITK